MTNAIFECLFAVVSLIVFALIYVFATAKAMPHFFLTPSYKKHIPKDRGIGKYHFPEGEGIVFEADPAYQKYLKKFVIFSYNNRKYIKCNTSEEIVSIRYEIVAFNSRGKRIALIEVAENLKQHGVTQAVLLPDNTAYASVVLKTVNEQEHFTTLRRPSILKISVFTLCTIGLTIAMGLLVRTAVLSIFSLLEMQSQIDVWISVLSATLIGALIAFLCVLTCKKQIFGEKQ